MSSGFMCYIHNGDTIHGTICSMYIHNEWYSDLHSRVIQLEYDIAGSLSMRYLAFAISSNNYEWEVLHVQDKENNTIPTVVIPEEYNNSFKLGIKLYDTPPTVGSVLNVGFDYVISGGIDLSELSPNIKVVTMSCETEGATIRYTLDDSEPIETSTEYAGAIEVEAPVTIKAKGFKEGLLPSEIGTLYIEEIPQCAKPTYEIKDGKVYLYCETEGASIYYNINRSVDPPTSSELYTTPIEIDYSITMVIKAIARKYDYISSEVLTITLQATVADPVVTCEANRVYMSCGTEYAEIYYTLDGTDPKTSETAQMFYATGVRIWEDTVVKAYAKRSNFKDSNVVTYNAIYDWTLDYDKLGYGNDTVGYGSDDIGYLMEETNGD